MTGISWAESYVGQLRALAGDRTLMFVGARGVLIDAAGRLLLIQRSDNGHWAMPAGAMELGESIADCVVREVWEETGLRPLAVTPFALHTGPAYTITNMYGDTYRTDSQREVARFPGYGHTYMADQQPGPRGSLPEGPVPLYVLRPKGYRSTHSTTDGIVTPYGAPGQSHACHVRE